MTVLDDLLTPGLRLVVCGTAAGRQSARRRLYYAGPGNKFWRILNETGLTPQRLDPAEYRRLIEFGIGLTDLAKSQAGSDRQITFGKSQREALRDRVQQFRPAYLCFNGKRAAKEFFGVREIGFGLCRELIGATRLFVAPSTSGAANASWNAEFWHQLAQHVSRADAAGRPAPGAGTARSF